MIAIDVGNTKVAIGLYESNRRIRHWRIGTFPKYSTKEYKETFEAFLATEGTSLKKAGPILLASVVPTATEEIKRLSEETELYVIDHRSPLSFKIALSNPQELGADRIAEMEGAITKYGAPLIVLGMGTATTLAAIDSQGVFRGGSISAGIGVSLNALYSSAALLVPKLLGTPDVAIGNSTDAAIASGEYLGHALMVEGLMTRMKNELKEPQLKYVGTGGALSLILPHLSVNLQNEPTLALDGLHSIYRNQREK